MDSSIVEYLRNMTDESKIWFNSRKASWNYIVDPPFAEVLTRQGYGFTFSMIAAEKIFNFDVVSKDFRFAQNKNDMPAPWKTKADERSGLKITLRQPDQANFKKSKSCHSSRFIIHDPREQPVVENGLDFDYGKSLEVLLRVSTITSDADLRNIDIKNRNCYVEHERRLEYFRMYTKSNCERECRSLIVFNECGCVPFHYVRNRTMKVCDIPGTDCAWRYKNLNHGISTEFKKCNCVSTCDSITYDFNVISTRYNNNEYKAR